jgi:ABC-type phosphate/phosphonate transport system permease subunit
LLLVLAAVLPAVLATVLAAVLATVLAAVLATVLARMLLLLRRSVRPDGRRLVPTGIRLAVRHMLKRRVLHGEGHSLEV